MTYFELDGPFSLSSFTQVYLLRILQSIDDRDEGCPIALYRRRRFQQRIGPRRFDLTAELTTRDRESCPQRLFEFVFQAKRDTN